MRTGFFKIDHRAQIIRQNKVDMSYFWHPLCNRLWLLLTCDCSQTWFLSLFWQIDSTWIVYNKPQNNQLTDEHAGFLMALGLNGHLNNLSYMNLHDYLCKVSYNTLCKNLTIHPTWIYVATCVRWNVVLYIITSPPILKEFRSVFQLYWPINNLQVNKWVLTIIETKGD